MRPTRVLLRCRRCGSVITAPAKTSWLPWRRAIVFTHASWADLYAHNWMHDSETEDA